MCNPDTFNMDESGLYWQQPVARWREGGLQEIRQEAHDCGPDCQRNWYTAAETHHHSHSAEASSVPKNFKVESALNVHWYFNKTAWMLSTVFQDWLRVCLHSTS
jgi:hypothetical protein